MNPYQPPGTEKSVEARPQGQGWRWLWIVLLVLFLLWLTRVILFPLVP
jgi:hypothetical protein